MASERERADVRERRREWIDKRQPRMRLQPARLVFIDETAVNTKMTRLRGRSRRGQRLRASAPFGRWGTQTFISVVREVGIRLRDTGAVGSCVELNAFRCRGS